MMRLAGILALTVAAACGATPGIAQEVDDISKNEIAVFETRYLGRGYDVTKGTLADTDSFKAHIYQVQSGWSKVYPVRKGKVYTATGKSYQKYAYDLEAEVGASGGVGAYSGEMKASFGRESEQSQELAFMSHTETFDKVSIRLDRYDWAPGVKKEITNDESAGGLSVKKVIGKYGTHFSKNIHLGGRLTVSSTMATTESTTSNDLSIAIKASYGTVSGNTGVTASDTSVQNAVNSKKTVRAYGGNVEDGTSINDAGAWRQTIAERPTICRFGPEGLVPIWELIEDRVRRDRLRKATDEYIARAAITDRNKNQVVKVNSKVRFRRVSNSEELLGINVKNQLHISVKKDGIENPGAYLYLTHPSYRIATSSTGSHVYFLKDQTAEGRAATYSGDQLPVTFGSHNPSTTSEGWYLEKVEGTNHSSAGRTIREFDEVWIGNWRDNSRVIGNSGNGKAMPLDYKLHPADSYTWRIELVD